MRSLGRWMQIGGLVFCPLAIVLQLNGSVNVGQMLTITVASVSLFFIGRLVEGYA